MQNDQQISEVLSTLKKHILVDFSMYMSVGIPQSLGLVWTGGDRPTRLVLSCLDYCNALLGGLNNRQLDRLQRVQNSAARVVYRVRQRDHITPLLRTLHWLPIRMRISFKICTYMFKAIHGLGPEYINCVVERYMPVVHCDRHVTAFYLK